MTQFVPMTPHKYIVHDYFVSTYGDIYTVGKKFEVTAFAQIGNNCFYKVTIEDDFCREINEKQLFKHCTRIYSNMIIQPSENIQKRNGYSAPSTDLNFLKQIQDHIDSQNYRMMEVLGLSKEEIGKLNFDGANKHLHIPPDPGYVDFSTIKAASIYCQCKKPTLELRTVSIYGVSKPEDEYDFCTTCKKEKESE